MVEKLFKTLAIKKNWVKNKLPIVDIYNICTRFQMDVGNPRWKRQILSQTKKQKY